MGSVPTVPDITPAKTQQTANVPTNGETSLDSILGGIVQAASSPLPPMYTSSTQVAQPNVQPVRQFTPQSTNNQPMTNQATSIKLARQKNNFAAIGNIIGMAGQRIQEKKQTELKQDLKVVMQAKQNVANAQAVLQQDPNNQMAKQVLDTNKNALNAILSDPRKQKQLAKALDISFTDPEQNKTPEVQAYKQATQEVKQAGAFNSNNPAEHQVAQMAQKNELGASLNTPQPGQQPVQAQQLQKSATPYADKALAKDLPGMTVNPQYEAALKNQQAAQKALYTNVLPKVIEAESRLQVQQARDGNAQAREQYKAFQQTHLQQQKLLGALDLQSQKAKDAVRLQGQRDAAAMGRVVTEVNARLKIADDKRLDASAKQHLQTESLQKIDQSLTALTNQRANLTTQLANATKSGDKDEAKMLQSALGMNAVSIQGTNQFRLETSEKVYGKLGASRDGGSESKSNSPGVSNTPIAGAGLSDEPDSDEDDDSDNF